MRILSHLRSADAKEMRRQGEQGFTMVEIAIAIGVIGFALVAIIGILPAGMNAQKDNREDTVVSQDAPYFLDAIRNGVPVSGGQLANFGYAAGGLDFLTNYVQSIQFTYYSNGLVNFVTNFPDTNLPPPYWTGAEIIGLLSTPQVNFNNPDFASNYFDIAATVRALSGPATAQQVGGNTGISSALAFTYKMEVMVTPFHSVAPDTTNYEIYPQGSLDYSSRLNRYMEVNASAVNANGNNIGMGALQYNLFDVQLRFSWPVFQNGKVGPGRQTYRTLVSSQIAPAMADGVAGWFFQPKTFANTFPQGL